MAKPDIELVKLVLQRNEVPAKKIAQILEELNMELAACEDEKAPPVKKEFVVLVSDPDNVIDGVDLVCWVLQIPEGDSPHVAQERVIQAAYSFNQTPKGTRMPVKSIGEACEHVSARLFKEEEVWVKTKEPILLTTTDNRIPRLPKQSD